MELRTQHQEQTCTYVARISELTKTLEDARNENNMLRAKLQRVASAQHLIEEDLLEPPTEKDTSVSKKRKGIILMIHGWAQNANVMHRKTKNLTKLSTPRGAYVL